LIVVLPSDGVESNIADGQGTSIIAITVRHLILVTVMSGDNNRVIDIVEVNILVNDIRDGTLTTGPGLDSDTILAVITGTVVNTNHLDGLLLATLTERTNTETVATVTDDVGQGDVGHASVDSSAVITNSEMRVLENDARRRRDIQGIRVFGELAACRGSFKRDVVQDEVLGVSDAKVSSRSIDDIETTNI
jgi:hypothetical protein